METTLGDGGQGGGEGFPRQVIMDDAQQRQQQQNPQVKAIWSIHLC